MKELEIESYKSYLNENHLYKSTLGASFNPSFLLIQPGSYRNETLNRLVFLHELAHAMLNTTYYGKIIFCFKMIELEYFQYFLDNGQNLHQKNKLIQIKKVLNELINGWILSQEGYATYTDYYHLTQNKDLKNEELLTDLIDFLKTKSPYSEGFNLYEKINKYFPGVGKSLFRELSSIDFIRIWKSDNLHIEKKIKYNNPDSILKKSIEKVLINGINKYFVLGKSQNIQYLWAQDFISEIDNEYRFIEITNYKEAITYISNFFLEELEIEEDFKESFKSRIEDLDTTNQKDYENLFNGDFRQLYILAKLNEKGIDFIGEHPSDFLQKEIQILYKKNLNLVDYLKKTKHESIYKSNANKSTILEPLTVIYRHVFSLQKIKTKMNKIEIKCSKAEAKEFTEKFSKLDARQIVTVDNNEERYSHWLETVTVVVSLTSASLQIIDILRNWLKAKKEENKTIVIVIEEKNYTLPEDYKLIEEKIEEIESEEKKTE